MQLRFAPILLASSILGSPTHSQEPMRPELRSALQAWRARYGPSWQLVYDEPSHRARMLFGGGAGPPFLPLDDGDWRLLGRYFLMEALPLLGVEHETLLHDGTIELPLAQVGTTDKLDVRFRQEIQGVPVQNGWVDVLFDGATGILLSIDSLAIPDAEQLDVTATVAGQVARSLAMKTFAAETGANPKSERDPRLVLLPHDVDGARIPTLAWEIDITSDQPDGGDAAWSYLVAARGTARVMARMDLIHEAHPRGPRQQQGRVTANATEDGCCFGPDDGSNRALFPMANLTVRFGDGSTTTTDANGLFTSPAHHPPGNLVEAAFQGPFVVVHNHAYWPEGDLAVQVILNERRPLSVLDPSLRGGLDSIALNPSPMERDVAQANAFYRAGQMRSWVLRVNPGDAIMDSSAETPGVPYQIIANWVIPYGDPGGQRGTAPCNSVFDSYAGAVKLSVSGAAFDQTCPNASFAPILWHELGHWLNERYGSGNDRRGFGEGNADAYAMYQMDQAQLSYDDVTRSGENVAPFCGDCASRQGCWGEPHLDGLPLMGALWKARRNLEADLGAGLGAALADALFLGWMNAYDQGEIHSIIEWQWLVLDDDDHDLSNLTPHLLPIDAAFREQGFPGFRLPVTTVICR